MYGRRYPINTRGRNIMRLKAWFFLLGIILLNGCVYNSALFQSSKGQRERCWSGGLLVGAVIANNVFEKCKKTYESHGYLPIEEVGFIGIVLDDQKTKIGDYIIAKVVENSPAAIAGIKEGDSIVAVDDIPPAGTKDLHSLLFGKRGTMVYVTVKNNDGEKSYFILREARSTLGNSSNSIF
jgi:S1-C subfamily serine protease